MNIAIRIVAVLSLILGTAWTATAQTIDTEGPSAAQPVISQSTRSGEREVILETPRQSWLGLP